MKHKPCAAFAALIAIPALATAQSVSPAEFKNVEAPTADYRPFGSNSTSGYRQVQIHDDLKSAKLTINELGFRRDGRAGRYSAFEFTTSIIMSTASLTAASISATFDSNHGSNKVTVVTNKTFKWPAQAADRVAHDFAYRIKLDAPYAFDGTNGGLCWEAQASLFRNIATTVYFDFASASSTNPQMAVAVYGDGCVHSDQISAASLTTSSSMNWPAKTGTIRANCSNMARNSLAIGAIGFSRTSLGAIPLPFMIPGSAQAYSGACYFHASLDLVFATSTDVNRSGNITIPIPVDVQYAGAKLYVQMFSVDDSTPALIKFITTNGSEMQFVPPYTSPALSRVYATGSFTATGSVQKNYGQVTAIY